MMKAFSEYVLESTNGKKAGFKVIKDYISGLGGYAFRVTSDGKKYNLQRRPIGGSAFKTMATLTQKEWDYEVEEYDIFGSNRSSPAIIDILIKKYRYGDF